MKAFVGLLAALTIASPAFGQSDATDKVGGLVITLGRDGAVALVDANGRRTTRVPAGLYVVTVRDRSAKYGVRFANPSGTMQRATRKPFVGVVRWRLRLRGSETYTYSNTGASPRSSGSLRVF